MSEYIASYYRDLKLKNIMFNTTMEGKISIKIISFHRFLAIKDRKHTPPSLKPTYSNPPEYKLKVYNEKADTWAIGIIMYTVLSGEVPFKGFTPDEFYQSIATEQIQFKGSYMHDIYKYIGKHWSKISVQAKRLIRGLLDFSNETRLSAKRALKSAWLNQNYLSVGLLSVTSNAYDAIDKLYHFKVY